MVNVPIGKIKLPKNARELELDINSSSDFVVDWQQVLLNGEVIVSADVLVQPLKSTIEPLAVLRTEFNAAEVTIVLQATELEQLNKRFAISCTINTNRGNTKTQAFVVKVIKDFVQEEFGCSSC